MNYQIYSKNIIITNSLREYLKKHLSRIDRLHYKVIKCRIDLSRDAHHKKGDVFRVEININIPRKLLRVVKFASDVRAAIDDAVDISFKLLNRYASKNREKKINRFRKLKDVLKTEKDMQ